jgi:hypothetical protein
MLVYLVLCRSTSYALNTTYPHPGLYPRCDADQDLLRLKHQLRNLPSNLLKHTHLSKIRQQDPRLFFSALRDDLTGL